MQRAIRVLATLTLLVGAVGPAQAGYVYVGSWDLATIGGGYGDSTNPFIWDNNPQVYSGVEAAAMLFGGNASDYAISTVDSNPADINNLAFVDGYADDSYLYSPTSDTYSLSSNGGGYNDYPSFSAYVVDHAPFDGPVGTFVNYVFREVDATATPEPATLTLLGIGTAGLAGFGWRRRKQHAANA